MRAFLALAGSALADEKRASEWFRRFRPPGDGPVSTLRVAPDLLLLVAGADPADVGTGLARNDRYAVAFAGRLHYLATLELALGATRVAAPRRDAAPADWVLAALTAWGDEGLRRLEGEFACIAWDVQQRSLIAARDHNGMWPLFYRVMSGGLAVASSSKLLSRIDGGQPTLNMSFIIDDATNLEISAPTETAFVGVDRVPASHWLKWTLGGSSTMSWLHEPPLFDRDSGLPFDDAAEQLRSLLCEAVAERVTLGRTGVALSGGYDSTAIFGAGNHALAARGYPLLSSVSLSHPPGDPGREDEWIEETTTHWGTKTNWVESEKIPAIDSAGMRAANRDEPLAHAYELWNEALAIAARAAGMEVLLNGIGGDAWFSGSPIFYSDLLRGGRLLQLRREWREHLSGTGRARDFLKAAIQPNLPEWAHRGLGTLRGGRRLKPLTYRSVPPWIRRDFLAREHVVERQFDRMSRRRRGESNFSAERLWFFENQGTARVTALLQDVFARHSVALSLPLMDWRVIRFAATRPRWENVSGASNKHLLRAALRNLVPDGVLAPRSARTGMPTTYFHRTAKAHAAIARDLMADGMVLAEQGIVEPSVLSDTVETILKARHPNPRFMHQVALLVEVELWLRGAVKHDWD